MRPRWKPVTLARAMTVAVAGVMVGALLGGCGIVRTLPPKQAIPGSPAASGPDKTPFVASEEVSPETVPVAGKLTPPPRGAYLGVYTPPAPFTSSALDQYELASGRQTSIVMWYQPWSTSNRLQFDAGTCLAIMRRGAVPMITWEPWDPGDDANQLTNPADQPKYKLSEINAGYYDDYIREWALRIRRLGGPVMLRPFHEMNGTWYPWAGTVNGNTPAEFVQAWRHVHDIFQALGATNVTWVWSVNASSIPSTPENSYAAYYPGDAYVDWTAVSGFNWGTARLGRDTWLTWDQEYAEVLAYLKTLPKPICLAEMASVEDGGDKAAWIADTYKRIAETPEIKAVVWYDSLERRPQDTEDWRIASTPESLDAYRKAIASPYYVSTPPLVLSTWASQLQASDWMYLSALNPVY